MAINSSNSSDPSAQVAQLIQASQTAAASKDLKGAAADLAEAKSLLTANPGAFDKDTLDKANNEITLLNADYTQGISLDGMTQDQHMAGFVSQVQALGISLSGSTASGVSNANLGTSSSGTSSTGLSTIGSGSSTSQGARLASSTTTGTSSSSGRSTNTDYTASGVTATGVMTLVAQSKVLKDMTGIANGVTAGTAAAGDKVDKAVTDLQDQLTGIYGQGAIPADVQTKYAALKTLRDKWTSGDTSVGPSLTSAKNALADSISTNGGGDSSFGWGDTSVQADGSPAAPTTASTTSSSSGSTSTGSSATGSTSSSSTVDYTKLNVTATGANTVVVQSKMLGDYKKIRDAVTAGKATSGYGVDSAVTDLQSQIKALFGNTVPADVQTQFSALSALRDKWASGDTSVGQSLNEASNQLAASISANGGGGSAFAWGDTSVNADGTAAGTSASTTSSASSSSTDSSATTSANHDWKDADVSFSASDISAAASASPPNYSKLGGYLDSLGDKLDGKLVGKTSKKLLGDLKSALKATPLDKQDVANAFAKFSSNGIKNNANADQKKAYDAVMSGILTAIGETGNTSVDKRGKSYVGEGYTAKL